MRILLCHGLGIRNLYRTKHLDNLCIGCLFAHSLMDDKRLSDLSFYSKYRVKTCHWLLEDNGYIISSYLRHILNGYLRQILTIKYNLTSGNLAVAVKELKDAHGRHTLATSTLSYYSQGLTCLNMVGNTVYSLNYTLLGSKEGF